MSTGTAVVVTTIKHIKGHLGVLRPRSGNYYGRLHSLSLRTTPNNKLALTITNAARTWGTDLYLDADEAATLMKMIATHMETVTTKLAAQKLLNRGN